MVGALEHDNGIEASRSAADGAGRRRRPTDGRVSADSVCNRPEIIRALHCVLQYVSDRPKRSALPNAGKPWTEADEAALMQMFDVGCSVEEMQARFQRTNGAIIRRLERLGRLRPGETMK